MFAAPPNVGYPTALSTAPNGDLYVGIDENGSLDAKPNRGRVVRCTDTDGDGKADQFVTFATMDSPRGIWFENTRKCPVLTDLQVSAVRLEPVACKAFLACWRLS